VIAANEVTKRYPEGREALRNVSFAITAGEMVFLTGHSGAGKSTLFKLLAAIERPTSGSIVINGQNLAALRSNAIPYLRRKLGLIFQDRKLLFDRSVLDNVLLPLAIVGHPAQGSTAPSTGGAGQGGAAESRAGRCRSRSPAASSSVWRLPARSSIGRQSFSPTNPPPTSTLSRLARSSISFAPFSRSE
jgi:ABC-type sugar transport system ATPase subunit